MKLIIMSHIFHNYLHSNWCQYIQVGANKHIGVRRLVWVREHILAAFGEVRVMAKIKEYHESSSGDFRDMLLARYAQYCT